MKTIVVVAFLVSVGYAIAMTGEAILIASSSIGGYTVACLTR